MPTGRRSMSTSRRAALVGAGTLGLTVAARSLLTAAQEATPTPMEVETSDHPLVGLWLGAYYPSKGQESISFASFTGIGSDESDWASVLNTASDFLDQKVLDSRDYSTLQGFLDEVSATGRPGFIYPAIYHLPVALTVGSNSTVYMYGSHFVDDNPNLGGDGTEVGMFDLVGDRIELHGGDFNGQKALFAHTEFKHAIVCRGCTDVSLFDIYAHDMKGDGVLIRGKDYTTTPQPARRIHMERVQSTGNYRQGMSIVFAENMTVRKCQFADMAGTPPNAGVDIEPYPDLEWVHHVLFDQCDFASNAGTGLFLCTFDDDHTIQYVTARDCRAWDNGEQGFHLFGAADTLLDNVHSIGNNQNGVLIERSDRVALSRARLSANTGCGLYIRPNSRVPGLDTFCNDIDIDLCRIDSNGQQGVYVFDGTVNGFSMTRSVTRGNTAGGLTTDNYDSLTTIRRQHIMDNNFMDGATLGVSVTT